MRRLRNEVVKAKIILSAALSTEVNLDAIAEGEDLTVNVTRAKLEQICKHHFDKFTPMIDTLLRDANLDKG